MISQVLSSVMNPLNKLLLFICLLLLSFSLGFGYLSYSFSKQIGALDESLNSCTSINRSLVLDVEKATKACLIADSVVGESIAKHKALDESKEEIVEKINSLPTSKPENLLEDVSGSANTLQQEGERDEEPSILLDIDSKLPDSLIRLLKESYNTADG